MMSHCRICRTEKNLKYTLKELRRINKKLNNTKDLIYTVSVSQTGNICLDCEERLHNFNKRIDHGNVIEIDCSSVARREDSPVIVDDDELLYNFFFNKQEIQVYSKLPVNMTSQLEFPKHSPNDNEDDEDEDVKVRHSSRENTPRVFVANGTRHRSSNFMEKTKPSDTVPTVIIDLEQEDAETESDGEKIVFRRVDDNVVKGKNNKSARMHRKLRRLADRDVKLVASLNLLSSDSELEEVKCPVENSVKQNMQARTTHVCIKCNLEFPALSELQLHQVTHSSAICPVCNASFTFSQSLVRHMRKKHRSYSGDVLKERPKCAQDSAMTIRLRYLKRHTYYECQLCGQIDIVFREHKHHVITKHPVESKSLRDPMMKELNCPLCKTNCGAEYLTLCAHLRAAHGDKHAPHLKEVSHRHPFGWSMERQQYIEKTSRVFQLLSRKSRYYECKNCQKLSSGYFNHWKHLSVHACGSATNEESNDSKNSVKSAGTENVKEPARNTRSVETKKIDSKKAQTKEILKSKVERTKHQKKANALCAMKTGANPKQLIKRVAKKPLKAAALVKVKVRPRLLQFPTLDYKCISCGETFKGFHALNIHRIKNHLMDEYKNCKECNIERSYLKPRGTRSRCPFDTKNKNELERKSLPDENSNTTYKQRLRKSSIKPLTATNSPQLTKSTKGTRKDAWLQDLLQFAKQPQCESSAKANIFQCESSAKVNIFQCESSVKANIFQCEYCTRLFVEHKALLLHEKQHVARKEVKTIKRIARNCS